MIQPTMIVAATVLLAQPAFAADRNFSVTGFDRVRVDGPYKVVLTTSTAPFARASGDAFALDGVDIGVQGRTLVIRPHRETWGGFPGRAGGTVTISIGTHDLAAAWVNGSGSLAIDRVRGLSFDVAIQGAGAVSIADSDVDQLKVAVNGTGIARIAGRAKKLTAIVRGASVFDGASLQVRDATLGAEGPATIRASVDGEAGVDARGLATVTLDGSPSCTVRSQGSASVAGCR